RIDRAADTYSARSMPGRDLRRAAAREGMRRPPSGHATDILSISIRSNFINLARTVGSMCVRLSRC
ncbi:hypothetical protein SB778_42455, partial [Paraburkholderia sp. SIMBA_050]